MSATRDKGKAMRARWERGLFKLFTIVVCLGCGCGNYYYAKQRELNALLRDPNPAHRIAEFKRRPFPEQIDLHLYAMKGKPPISLAEYLAADGEAVLPAMMNRLESETDEQNQTALIQALGTMSIVMPSIRTNEDLIGLVRRRTSEMRDSYSKALAEESLNSILGPSQVDGATAKQSGKEKP